MIRIRNQAHDRQTLLYALSRLLERAAYYGVRALLVIYITGEVIQMPSEKALHIVGLFATSILIWQVVGALIGDFLIGHKKSIIIGGILQAVAAFCFCIPSMLGVYVGIFLMGLGSGLYSPNILAKFGKLYLNKTKLLDAGFTLFYIAVNIGAFVGIVLIGVTGERYGWNMGFCLAGIIMLLSTGLALIAKDKVVVYEDLHRPSINRRIGLIATVFIILGLYWMFYNIGNIKGSEIQQAIIEQANWDLPFDFWYSINFRLMIPIGLIIGLIWSYFYTRQFVKLALGFLFASFSLGLTFFIPAVPLEQHIVIYLISLVCLVISELHVAPIIYSVLTKYTNPKYLATAMSLVFIPTRLFVLISGSFSDKLHGDSTFSLKVAFIAMSLIFIVLLVCSFAIPRQQENSE